MNIRRGEFCFLFHNHPDSVLAGLTNVKLFNLPLKPRITATRPIGAGEELTVNYDTSVGYEEFGSAAVVADFLALCALHGVEKRPSRLNLPPLRVIVN